MKNTFSLIITECLLLPSILLLGCEKEGLVAWHPRDSDFETTIYINSPLVKDAGQNNQKTDSYLPDTTSPDATPADATSVDTAPADTLPSDLKNDTVISPLGTNCSKHSNCRSGFCTDGVCCETNKCVDTCRVGGSSACTPYAGFTCAPYGTCRGF